MFTQGRLIFVAFFVIAFVILMVISYRKDKKNHQSYYKGAAKKVIVYGIIAIAIFVALRYLTSKLF